MGVRQRNLLTLNCQCKEGASDVTTHWGTPLTKIPIFIIFVTISNTIRCYHDSWLHLSILTTVLSFSFQTSTTGNDDDTIFSSSFWSGVGAASYFETFKRFFAIFKCNKNENSVKARDQRIIFCFDEWEIYACPRISCLSFFYTHTFIFHQ